MLYAFYRTCGAWGKWRGTIWTSQTCERTYFRSLNRRTSRCQDHRMPSGVHYFSIFRPFCSLFLTMFYEIRSPRIYMTQKRPGLAQQFLVVHRTPLKNDQLINNHHFHPQDGRFSSFRALSTSYNTPHFGFIVLPVLRIHRNPRFARFLDIADVSTARYRRFPTSPVRSAHFFSTTPEYALRFFDLGSPCIVLPGLSFSDDAHHE